MAKGMKGLLTASSVLRSLISVAFLGSDALGSKQRGLYGDGKAIVGSLFLE